LPHAGAAEGHQAAGEEHEGLLVKQRGEEDVGGLERQEPGGEAGGAGTGELVDGNREQDDPGDRDPGLGDAQDGLGRADHQDLAGEDELVELAREDVGPLSGEEGRVADVLGVDEEPDLVAARSDAPRPVAETPNAAMIRTPSAVATGAPSDSAGRVRRSHLRSATRAQPTTASVTPQARKSWTCWSVKLRMP